MSEMSSIPPAEDTKPSSYFSFSPSHSHTTSFSNFQDSSPAANPTRFSVPLTTHQSSFIPSSLSSLYNANLIHSSSSASSSKSNHALSSVEGVQSSNRKRGSQTKTRQQQQGVVAVDEDEQHEHEDQTRKEQETDTGSYNFSGGNKQEAVNQQHDLDYNSHVNVKKRKGGSKTSPSRGQQWTGLKYPPSSTVHSNSYPTPDPSLNNNLYQNFSRDPIDWSAILSSYNKSNENFNEASLQDLMNHVAAGVSSASSLSSPSGVSQRNPYFSPAIKEHNQHSMSSLVEEETTGGVTITGNNINLALKRGGYTVAELPNPSLMIPSPPDTSLPVRMTGDSFSPIPANKGFKKNPKVPSNSRTRNETNSKTSTSISNGHNIYPIDLDENSSSGETISLHPSDNNNDNNNGNNNGTRNKDKNLDDEEEDDPPADIYANIGEDSSEKAYSEDNNIINNNNYGHYSEYPTRYGYHPSRGYPGRLSFSGSKNYLRRPYSSFPTDPSSSISSPDLSYPYPGGYYSRYYSTNPSSRYHSRYPYHTSSPDLSSSSSSTEMNHADPSASPLTGGADVEDANTSSSSSSVDKSKIVRFTSSPYPYYYYDPSAYHSHHHSHDDHDADASSPYYSLSHRHEGSPSRSPAGLPSLSGLTGLLLGIIPLSLLVASIVPAFVTVPVASSAASVASVAGRRRRKRELNYPVSFNTERENYLNDILQVLHKYIES